MSNSTDALNRWFGSLTPEERRACLSVQPYRDRRIADLMAGVATPANQEPLAPVVESLCEIERAIEAIFAMPDEFFSGEARMYPAPPLIYDFGEEQRLLLATERERASSVDRMLRPNLASGRWGHHHVDYLGEAGYFSADEIVENMMRMEEPE